MVSAELEGLSNTEIEQDLNTTSASSFKGNGYGGQFTMKVSLNNAPSWCKQFNIMSREQFGGLFASGGLTDYVASSSQ